MSGDTFAGRRQPQYDPLAVLDYIDAYQRSHANRSPSQQHIRTGLDLSAPSALHGLLHELVRAGLLLINTSGAGQPADLEITALGWQRLRQWRTTHGGAGDPPRGELA